MHPSSQKIIFISKKIEFVKTLLFHVKTLLFYTYNVIRPITESISKKSVKKRLNLLKHYYFFGF